MKIARNLWNFTNTISHNIMLINLWVQIIHNLHSTFTQIVPHTYLNSTNYSALLFEYKITFTLILIIAHLQIVPHGLFWLDFEHILEYCHSAVLFEGFYLWFLASTPGLQFKRIQYSYFRQILHYINEVISKPCTIHMHTQT